MMLNNMKIGKKLLVFFLVVAIISGVGSVVGLCVMLNMNNAYSSALNNYGFSQGDIGRLSTYFSNSRSWIKDIIIYTDAKSIKESSDKLDKKNLLIDQMMEKIKGTINGDKERSLYDSINSGLKEYTEASKKIVGLAKQNKNSEAFALMKSNASVANKISNEVNR